MKYAQAAIFLVALCLSGCSGMRLVDNQVESFSTLSALPAPATYRFERLPSQQANAAAQDALEIAAQSVLNKLGLQAASGTAAFTAQISARTERDDYAGNPYGHRLNDGIFAMPGLDYVVTGSGRVIWTPSLLSFPHPYYQREISLVLRDAKTNTVVFETRARHEGRWSDSNTIYGAMLEAALQGFPQPPAGSRRVDVQIPR
jgi:Domain of unknown function (DUF4136)